MNSKKYLFPFTAVTILFLWEAVTRLGNIPDYILPSPTTVVNQNLHAYVLLGRHFMATLVEVLIGMSIGITLALVIAIMFHWSSTIKEAFFPFARVVNSTPIAAIAALIIIWFGVGIWSKVVIAIICTLFPIVIHTYHGLESVDSLREKFMDSRNASRLEKLFYLELPYAASEILSAIETAVTYVIVGVFIGEMFGSNKGLGFYVLNLKYRMDTPKVILATFTTMGLGLCLASIVALGRRFLPWLSSNSK